MKRIITVIIVFVYVVLNFEYCICAAINRTTTDINQFSSKLAEMISTFDTYNIKEDEVPKHILAQAEKNNATDKQRYDFSSLRLLVDSKQRIDTLNAVSVVSGYRDIWVLQFDSIEKTVEAYDYYSSLPFVKCVEPDSEITISANWESSADSAKSNFLSWGPEYVGFDQLLDAAKNQPLEKVSVAVIDTGIDSTHPFLADRIEETGFDVTTHNSFSTPKESGADDNGHGTHVAGIIADSTTPNVLLRPYKVLDRYGIGSTSQVVAGIYQAIEDKVDVINMSLGGNYSSLEERAIEAAESANIVVVASAGNNANDVTVYPAGFETTLSVSSIDENGALSGFSSYGDSISIAAPGSNINSTFPEESFKELSGTSMAAPFVSAACSMAKSIHRGASSKEVRALLLSTASAPAQEENANAYYGYGFLNAPGVLNNLPNNPSDYEFTEAPKILPESDAFCDVAEIVMTAEPEDTVYYTLDGSQPNRSSFIYTSPIVLKETKTISAVSYSETKRKSKIITKTIHVAKPLENSEIEINSDGIITSCLTDKDAVYIPNMINNIIPVSIDTKAFSSRETKAAVLLIPESVKTIKTRAFYGNAFLKRVYAHGVIDVGDYAFASCKQLESITLPKAQHIGSYCFSSVNESTKIKLNLVLSGVEHIDSYAFCKSMVQDLHLPNLKDISEAAFAESLYLQFVSCDNLRELSDYAFENCISLTEVNLPKLEIIPPAAFQDCESLYSPQFPSCTVVDAAGFCMCDNLRSIFMPEMNLCEISAFDLCDNIIGYEFPLLEEIFCNYSYAGNSTIYLSPSTKHIVLPSLKKIVPNAQFYITSNIKNIILTSLDMITAIVTSQSNYTVDYVDLSSCQEIALTNSVGSSITFCLLIAPSLEMANWLPDNSSIVVSSSLQSVTCDMENMTFYGIPGSYVEQYANENGHIFIPIPYIDNEYVPDNIDAEEIIEVDAIGFSLSYQWFASYDGTTENAVLLEGETNSILNISSTKKAPYYFCVVKCNDKGTLYSSSTAIIQNTAYTIADYSELDEIIATIPEDLSIYTEDSVEILNSIIENIDYNLDASEQDTVDGYVEAISSAIDNLQLKTFTVTFFADEQYKYEYSLSYGETIIKPDEPYKNGYTFKGWTPEIPETMPAYDLNFYAVFEENTQADTVSSVEIKNYVKTRTVDYKTTITFTAITKNMLDNATIYWYIDGEKAGEGERITIEKATDAFNVQAKIIDASGKIISTSETELIKVKNDLFSRLIAFFRMLFGKLPVIEQ